MNRQEIKTCNDIEALRNEALKLKSVVAAQTRRILELKKQITIK